MVDYRWQTATATGATDSQEQEAVLKEFSRFTVFSGELLPDKSSLLANGGVRGKSRTLRPVRAAERQSGRERERERVHE